MTSSEPYAGADDDRLTDLDFRILGLVARGYQTRAALSDHAKCAVNSVPRSLKRLESYGYVLWTRGGGRGRASTVTLCAPDNRNPEVIHNPAVSVSAVMENPTVTVLAEKRNAAVTVSCGEVLPPVDKPVGKSRLARAQTLTKLNTYQDYTDTVVPSLERERALATDTQPERLSGPMTETMPYTQAMRDFAASVGFVNGTGEALFEQFRDHNLSKNGISANWQASWRKWVRDEIKYRGAPKAHEPKSNHGRSSFTRGKTNAYTELLLRDILGDKPNS